jgi:redox-sensitive bicupin YhaK (pirin superfamily)
VSVEIRRASDRFVDRSTGRLSHHGFAFGGHYDPDRLSFGPMVCHDDHLLGSGVGFDEHPHEGLEIITWVVSGSLEHRDSTGTSVTLGTGECGLLSAGSGVRHSEIASPDGPARFVQVWLTPATPDREPSYAATPVTAGPGSGLVPVAGTGGALAVDVPGAGFSVARLGAGESVSLPSGERVHVFVTTGALLRFSLAEPLSAGDALLMSGEGAHTVTAAVPTELLVWSFA